MKAAGVDYIFYGGYYGQAGQLVKQLRAAGVTAVFVSGDGSLDQKFVDNAGARDAEGALITATGAPANINPDFQQKFNAEYKKDPGALRARVVRRGQRVPRRHRRRQAWIARPSSTSSRPTTSRGSRKQIKFDAKGEVTGEAVYSYEVKGGKINGTGIIQ